MEWKSSVDDGRKHQKRREMFQEERQQAKGTEVHVNDVGRKTTIIVGIPLPSHGHIVFNVPQ